MTSDKLKVSDLINRDSILPLAYTASGSSPSTLGFILSFSLALLFFFFYYRAHDKNPEKCGKERNKRRERAQIADSNTCRDLARNTHVERQQV